MKKKLLSLAVVSTLSLSLLLSPAMVEQVNANDDISSLLKQDQNIDQKQSSLNAEIEEKESKINELKSEQENLGSEIKRLDLAVADATSKIEEKNAEIEQTEKDIEQLEVEIAELTERIEKRNEMLKDRAASYQESGGSISYLDVLFGAQSFSDFIDRISAVATLVQADKEILEQHQADKIELETKQTQINAKLDSLKEMKEELESLKASLDSQIEEKNQLMNTLKQEEKAMHAEVKAAEEEQGVLAAQAATIQRAIQLEQARQKAAPTTQSSSGGETASVETTVSTPPVSSGSFTWPASGTLTSGYGSRSGGFHNGMDIAKRGPGIPIVATADGVVIRSYYSSSYGNVVFISHSINGQVFTSVYAHMSNRIVESGAVVKKGERIGTMGNTGQSFGQHVHFELHKGPWNFSKSNGVNPMSYLP